MKKPVLLIAFIVAFALVPAVSADAQSPAPPATPAAATAAPTAQPTTAAVQEDSDARPWIRLTWLVPLAVLVAAGSIFGRRLLIERGWLDAA